MNVWYTNGIIENFKIFFKVNEPSKTTLDDNVWTYLAILALYYLFFYGIIMHSPDKCFFISISNTKCIVSSNCTFLLYGCATHRSIGIYRSWGWTSFFVFLCKSGLFSGLKINRSRFALIDFFLWHSDWDQILKCLQSE